MKTYVVTVTQTRSTNITVYADSEEEAKQEAEQYVYRAGIATLYDSYNQIASPDSWTVTSCKEKT